MNAPLSDKALAEVFDLADRIAELPVVEMNRALKTCHEHPAEARVPGVELDDRQVHALVTDQVRLRQLRRPESGSVADGVSRALRAFDGARVAVLSGAGISVDAGFPTFRGEERDSLWSRFDPMTLASTWGFAENPMRTLEWYCWRRRIGLPAVPTLAHAALSRAQARARGDEWAGCHTQNVDGLHEAAGSTGVNRIHGSIWCWKDPRTLELTFDPSDRVEDVPRDDDGHPRVRPGVVMFGDNVPPGVYDRAVAQALRAEVALVVGTSAQVSTLWPLLHAARQGDAQLVEVNPEPILSSELGALAVPFPAGVGVPLALEAIGALKPEDTDALARTPRTPLRDALPRLATEFLADA